MALSVVEKLRRRRRYPVEIDGETVHVRAVTDSEKRTVMPFRDEEESFGYLIGKCLLNDDGSAVCEQQSDEDAKAFGARVLAELDLPTDTQAQLATTILKLAAGPTPEQLKAIEKN